MTDLSDPAVRIQPLLQERVRLLQLRLIRLVVADITRDVLRRRRLGWRA